MNKNDPAQSQAKANDTGAAPSAPAGFQELNLDMPSWNWESQPLLLGKIVDVDIFHTTRGEKRVFIVKVEDKLYRLIEQAGIRRLFEKCGVGDELRIEATGFRQLDDNQEMRTFTASIKQAPQRSPAQQSTDAEMRRDRPSRKT